MEISDNCFLCQEPSQFQRASDQDTQLEAGFPGDVISLHLPFINVSYGNGSRQCCSGCVAELNQFQTFFNKIKALHLGNDTEAIDGEALNVDPFCERSSAFPEECLQNNASNRTRSRRNEKDVKKERASYQLAGRKSYRRRTDVAVDETKMSELVNMNCDLCNEKLDSFNQALSHHKEVHDQKGYLICCSRKFKQKSVLLGHLDFHANPENFQCKICSKNLTSSSNLRAHIALKHLPQSRFQCDQCGNFFNCKFRLANHVKKHFTTAGLENSSTCHNKGSEKSRETFCCEVCGRELRSKSSLKEHIINTHADQTDKIECKLCGHYLKNVYSMKKHLIRHKQMEENITCEHCGRKCTTKAALRSHVRMKHLLERTLPCSFCEKKFKQKIDLTEHEATHRGIDLYKCLWCPAGFKFGANFRAHRKNVHPEEYEKIKPAWLRPN